MQPKDLADVLTAIENAEPHAGILALIMLALGTRIGETRSLKWQFMDVADKRLIIPAELTKTRVEHVLPLSDWLLERLAAYREQTPGEFLFPATGGKCAVSERNASYWIRSISKGNWSAHDLRKLARTSWADLGIDYMVAEQLLNHSMSKLDKAYIHTYMETQKRAAIEQWHGILSGKFVKQGF